MSQPNEYPVCRVYLLDTLYHIDKLYDYYIPPTFRADVTVGGFVAVPFGRTTRRFLALVVECIPTSSSGRELKPVLGVINPGLVLTQEQMQLCTFLKEHTFCTMGDAVRALLPTAAFTALMMTYEVNPSCTSKLERQPTHRLMIYSYIAKLGAVPESRLVQRFGVTVKEDLTEMVARDILREVPTGRGTEEKTLTLYRLAIPEQEAARMLASGELRGTRQIEAVRLILHGGALSASDLRQNGITAATCDSLLRRGILQKEEQPTWRDPFAAEPVAPPPPAPLSPEQAKAFSTIQSLIASGQPKAALLHGVTGSGKTRVMKAVIDEIVSRGRSVILLVPEIALTPQTVGYFRAYYGERTAVMHSMLSAGERYDAWQRMRRGEIDLCIGTRSAVFAPLPNLGAILIDEEQEHTYKSDSAPKYHAIDIARFRCAYHKALMLLSSATPSFESYTKAKQGLYTLIPLASRFGGAQLPTVSLADLRKDAAVGRLSPIGSELRSRMGEVLSRGEQAILFVNRRGYHNFLSCPLCGHVVSCPHCSVSLTLHNLPGSGSTGLLRCHYCGYTDSVPTSCPSCHSPGMRHVGYGTQLAEEELKKLFPTARIMRMDADTTSGKMAHRDILSRFRAHEADILLGTQMVTKGHDFPDVTLVGVLSADGSLYLDDFRAAERTFSLLTQVVGRAGRGQKAGEALIQTTSPSHALFPLVRAQDYDAFYRQEIELRRALAFPPFCDLVTLTVSGREEAAVLRVIGAIDEMRQKMLQQPENIDIPIQVFGPMELPVYRVNEVYRMRLVIKCRLTARTRAVLSTLLTEASRLYGRTVSITLDPNPESI